MEINVLCAARCVLELQTKAGEHIVEGTGLKFQIHCGLCSGILESEIFEAPLHNNMQRLYHYVGGGAYVFVNFSCLHTMRVCVADTF